MIVGVVGTKGPFPRLIAALAAWARAHPDESVWVQCADGALPAELVGVQTIARDALLARLRDARVVVTHAGSGTVRDALALGHVPVVVPRRAAHGEHINDHQLELTEALAARIVACLDPTDAPAFAAAIAEAASRRGPPLEGAPAEALIADLRAALARVRPPTRSWLWRVVEPLTRAVRLRRL